VRPRLHWCPTGAFIFAPIHAAGVYDGSQQECCADYVVSSYTPTVAALLRAQQNAQAYTVPQLLVSLLAVARAQDAKLPTLHSVHAELDNVAEVCRKMSVAHQVRRNQESTTTMEVMLCLESANIVHIACHGVQHATDPLSSAFCLSDGSLTVSQLMKLDLTNAFFAFLGACETAKGDKQQPDQAIHLAATMLFIGFKSIVATMWRVI
jgi:CHAT domain-containing protein